jgi:hypothetical protein
VKIEDDSGRFFCEYCGNEHVIRVTAEAVAPAQEVIHPRVPVPPEVRIEKDGKSAVIYQRWYSFKYIPMAFFCVAWDAFLVYWYGMAFSQNAPWIFVVFPVAHLAVGIWITYSTLAGFFNRTVLEVTSDEVSVWSEPLPWPGEKTIKTANLKQLFCKEKKTRTKHGYRYTYQLLTVTRDDRQTVLISNLESPDLALFFEQQVEDWLRIKDRRVVGELRR